MKMCTKFDKPLFLLAFVALLTNAFCTLAVTTMGNIQGFGANAASSSPSANTQAFQGFYLGANAAMTHLSAKIEGRRFSGTGASGGIFMGYGTSGDKVYGAGELEVSYGSVKTTKDTIYKLKSAYDASVAGLVGVFLRDTIMPYFKLGVGVHGYEYTYGVAQRKKFNSLFVAPSIGIQALLNPNFLMRLEFAYSIPVSTSGIQKRKVGQKPNRSFIKLGGAYKF